MFFCQFCLFFLFKCCVAMMKVTYDKLNKHKSLSVLTNLDLYFNVSRSYSYFLCCGNKQY